MSDTDYQTVPEIKREVEISISQLNDRLREDPDRTNGIILESFFGDDFHHWESVLNELNERGTNLVLTLNVGWRK